MDIITKHELNPYGRSYLSLPVKHRILDVAIMDKRLLMFVQCDQADLYVTKQYTYESIQPEFGQDMDDLLYVGCGSDDMEVYFIYEVISRG